MRNNFKGKIHANSIQSHQKNIPDKLTQQHYNRVINGTLTPKQYISFPKCTQVPLAAKQKIFQIKRRTLKKID